MKSILLVTVDCLRQDHVHAFGYPRQTTPNIDTVAADSVNYVHAYSNGPGTRWAFRAINMGVYPLQITGAGLPVNQGWTLAELLAEQNYQTAAFSDNPFLTSYFNHDRGFKHFQGSEQWAANTKTESTQSRLQRLNALAGAVSQRLSNGLLYRTLARVYNTIIQLFDTNITRRIPDEEVVDAALDWLADAQRSSDPYFLWVHLMDAHHPHQYNATHRDALGIPDDSRHVRVPPTVVESGTKPKQSVIDTYDANLREADAQVGRLVDAVADDTLVVITGDHGEEFGRHGGFHDPSVYESMARVPLIVRSPTLASRRITQAVSHIDVPPTILARATNTVETPESWRGMPLDDSAPPSRDIFLGFEDSIGISGAVLRAKWKYHTSKPMDSSSKEPALYNIEADPRETTNIQSEEQPIFDALQSAWQSHLNEVRENAFDTGKPLYDSSGEDSIRDAVESESQRDLNNLDERLEHLGYK